MIVYAYPLFFKTVYGLFELDLQEI